MTVDPPGPYNTMTARPVTPDAEVADPPMAPPSKVTRCLPAFSTFGPGNCGAHEHIPEVAERRARRAATEATQSCVRCKQEFGSREMHPLACEHSLCRDCLTHTVVEAGKTVRGKGAVPLRAALATMRDQRQQGQAASSRDKGVNRARVLLARADEGRIRAYRAAGATCCGRPMPLERWQDCMQPHAARLWYGLSWMLQTTEPVELITCGWPDCGMPIPVPCRYYSKDGRGSSSIHVYLCLICGANSQRSSLPDTLIPSR